MPTNSCDVENGLLAVASPVVDPYSAFAVRQLGQLEGLIDKATLT